MIWPNMVGHFKRIFFKSQFTCQYKNGSIVALYYYVKVYIYFKNSQMCYWKEIEYFQKVKILKIESLCQVKVH